MSETEHEPNQVEQIRAEYEGIRDRNELHATRAIELLTRMEGAVDYFQLGLRLGKEGSGDAERLAAEISKYIGDRKTQLHEGLFPKGGTGSKKMGG